MAIEDDIKLCTQYLRQRDHAINRKIPFNLSLKKFRQLKQTTHCYYTGIKLITGEEASPTAWSLDRLDNNKGYEDNNVVVACHIINAKKSNLTIDEIKAIYNGLEKKKLI